MSNNGKISDIFHIDDKMNECDYEQDIIQSMNKINPITCVATSNLEVQIPDDQGRNIVLYFYPKDDTPGCTTEGQDFTRLNQEFISNNAVIYGVSRESIASHDKFICKYGFNFDLISDPDGTLCNQFGVIRPKKLYGKEYVGIVRSTFIITPEGNVLKHWDNVKVKGHAEEVLEAVKSL